MFERFTERARHVLVLAQDEARMLGHDYIGTEHILLGLLREEDGIAARVLDSFEIMVEEVRAQVVHLIGQGHDEVTGQIPFTPRAKHVLELALREGLALGHAYIGTEHILLGLVREADGVGARILLDLGADAETIQRAVVRMLSGPAPASATRTYPIPRAGSHRGGRATSGRRRPTRAVGDATTGPARLTRGARNALLLAQEEARALKHTHVGSEHILLGLLREEHGLAARLLASLGITLAEVHDQVVQLAGEGKEVTTGHLPFTPEVKDALETAHREAQLIHHDYVGTEHVLLSLLLQDKGTAARILRNSRH
jgi:ATP-dependent Clp protease ATP-binding subunit ClpA